MTVVPIHADPDPVPGLFEHAPPQNLDAEQSALGAQLMEPREIVNVQGIIEPDDYYRPGHQTIQQVILDLAARGERPDPITVAAELTRRGELDRVGGPQYLHALFNAVSVAASAEYYAEIIRECAVRRRLAEAATRIRQDAHSGEGTVDEIVAAAAAEIAAVVEGRGREDDFVTPAQSLAGTLDRIEQAGQNTGLSGVSTGFTDLDHLTNGLQPGQLVIVAGRPAMGKSTLGMDMARACAVRDRQPAAYISLEMSTDELNMRMLSAEEKIGLHHIRSGRLSDDDWAKLARAVEKTRDAPLFIDESSRHLADIQAKLRRLKARRPDLALAVVDYMQLITVGGGRRPDSREQEVAEVSRSLKLLAKELQIPIVALAQLNRGPEMRSDKKPTVSDLRESGSQEQDADIIILLFRPDAYEAESERAGEVDLIVAKHRNGATPTITVAAQLHYARFVDMAEE